MRELSYLHSLGLVQLLKIVLLGSEHNTGPGQIVRREFHRYLVAGKNADIVHPHFTRDVSEHHVAVFQLHAKGRVRQQFADGAGKLEQFFLSHAASHAREKTEQRRARAGRTPVGGAG